MLFAPTSTLSKILTVSNFANVFNLDYYCIRIAVFLPATIMFVTETFGYGSPDTDISLAFFLH
jgi:hypothetical protein